MRRLAALLTVLLLAVACTSAPVEQPIVADTAGATPGSVAAEPSGGGAASLAFTADTVDGGTVDSGDYAGRDLMIWFWAPW